MNRQEADVLQMLVQTRYINQRALAQECGHSLGIVNRSIKKLIQEGYLDEAFLMTEKAQRRFRQTSPQSAIILAAGFGTRMVPINMETPKALLEVKGEPLIERLIKQLHAVGIHKIHVVVGFRKESFEYLIDEYAVELVVNTEYIQKNNLHSLKLVAKQLANAYVIPCDLWCATNPFRHHELYSWYMVSDASNDESCVKINRKMELVRTSDLSGGNTMIGIAYFTQEQAEIVGENISQRCNAARHDDDFWEEALYEKDHMLVQARVMAAADIVEINTYEQLRELDGNSNQLQSNSIGVIAQVLGANIDEITEISVLKKGMTNRSFLFQCKGEKYIMRIPGEGTEQLINRRQEAEVYAEIADKKLCDNPIYINWENGYKITRYIENVHCCDPLNASDLRLCMKKLRQFHKMGLAVKHEFNLFNTINFYESLWGEKSSVYKDYYVTKERVISLKPFIAAHAERKVLAHIDAVPDNFLFNPKEPGELFLQLTDWEYAGMQDPHVDIAMFCIYSLYNKTQVDDLIVLYFEGMCPKTTRLKIYCYIAVCGLLWSNWCEYKKNCGVEFGEYALRQYRFAKEYYNFFIKEATEDRNENRSEKQ